MDTSSGEFSLFIDTILEDFFSESEFPAELMKTTKEMFHHLIPDHYFTSMPFVLPKLCKIINPNVTKEKQEMALSLGWIYQMLQSYYLAIDDYLDDSDVRYGKPTWSKLHNHLKSVIVPDLSVIRAVAFFTLRKKYSHLPDIYLQLLQICVDCDISYSQAIRLEQHQLIKGLRDEKVSLESFNLESWKLISRLQGSVFIYMPVALAMTLSGFKMNEHKGLYNSLENICGNFSVLMKLTDDYNEVFNPSVDFDSSDEDIRGGHFTWLFLMAKESCISETQITDLLKHYGRDNDESVNFVKDLLEKADIHAMYKKYRQELTDEFAKEMDSSFKEFKVVKEMMTVYFGFWKKFLNQ